MKEINYWVYILHCENGTLYTGYTTDLIRRYREHVTGSGKCKYTRSFKPLSVAQWWAILGSKSEAMRIEKFIKTLSKKQKQELILQPELLENRYLNIDKNKIYC
jgi:putative endonuclease